MPNDRRCGPALLKRPARPAIHDIQNKQCKGLVGAAGSRTCLHQRRSSFVLGHTRNAAFLTLFNAPSRILVGVPVVTVALRCKCKKICKNPLNAKLDDSRGAPMISDERRFEFESAIRRDVPRDLLVEIEHQFGLAAQQAEAAVSGSQTAVTHGVALSRRRASRATGLVRFQIIDEMFEQMLNRHGAEFVKSVPIEQGQMKSKTRRSI